MSTIPSVYDVIVTGYENRKKIKFTVKLLPICLNSLKSTTEFIFDSFLILWRHHKKLRSFVKLTFELNKGLILSILLLRGYYSGVNRLRWLRKSYQIFHPENRFKNNTFWFKKGGHLNIPDNNRSSSSYWNSEQTKMGKTNWVTNFHKYLFRIKIMIFVWKFYDPSEISISE